MRQIIVILGTIISLSSCGGGAGETENPVSDTPATRKTVADLVPPNRAEVKKEAVATYTEKIANPLNDWKFQVSLYETSKTFRYLMRLEYEEMKEKDTLKIPNLGFEPRLEIHKGDEPYSCIIGFLDKENKFREYKKVIAKNNNLRVITLRHYAVYAK
jgi:hypothetical protein